MSRLQMTSRTSIRLAAMAFVATLSMTADVFAESAPQAGTPPQAGTKIASCLTEANAVPAAEVEAFKANPGQLLDKHRGGGLPLSTDVRNLLATDPSLLAAFVELTKRASGAQKQAIGSGLGQAVVVCKRTDPNSPAIRAIQEQVFLSNDATLYVAFVAASNAVETAAIGGGGSTAGVGGALSYANQGGAGNFGTSGGSDSSYSTYRTGFSTRGGGGSSVSTTTSVSPTR